MQINWQQFGLKTNPYDMSALVEGGDLSITDAFIGREKERQFLDDLFASEDGARLTICGDTGVGKTSLANLHKVIWKYSKEKLLFSCRREIEASDTLLDKQNFILEIIGSVLREISLLQPDLLNDKFLLKLQQIVDISQMMAISGGLSLSAFGFGGGGNLSRDKKSSVPTKLSTASLEQHFVGLLDFIKKHEIDGREYSGLMIHVNNFDVVLGDNQNRKKVIAFFNEIRDFLQTKDTYFLFLGPADFYSQAIAVERRVKSIFSRTPLLIKPLSKKEVVEALDKRMSLLKSEDAKQYIKPIVDDVIFRLYDLYDGDIRSIMTGIKDILGRSGDRLLQPLSMDEAMLLLGRERWEKIGPNLTKERKKILEFLVTTNKYMNVTEASKILNKQRSNISGYYFQPLKDLGIIEEKERRGTNIYFGLTADYEPLKWWFESEKKIEKEIGNAKITQAKLFDL